MGTGQGPAVAAAAAAQQLADHLANPARVLSAMAQQEAISMGRLKVQVGQGLFAHVERTFTGQEPPCGVQVAMSDVCVDATGERCDVGDGHRPLVGVEVCGFTGEAELE